jgi:ribosome biogenesis protein MAK21
MNNQRYALFRKLLDPNFATSTKQALFLNLLYKSLKRDPSADRVKAFAKRILQVSQFLPPQLICGCLYLVSEVAKAKPELKLAMLAKHQALQQQQGNIFLNDDDEESDGEEHYQDVKEDDDAEEEGREGVPTAIAPAAGKPSWIHHKNIGGRPAASKALSSRAGLDYNPQHRNPRFCGAGRSPVYEIGLLSSHYHPSVAMFAASLMQGDNIR